MHIVSLHAVRDERSAEPRSGSANWISAFMLDPVHLD